MRVFNHQNLLHPPILPEMCLGRETAVHTLDEQQGCTQKWCAGLCASTIQWAIRDDLSKAEDPSIPGRSKHGDPTKQFPRPSSSA